jgi:hypothetical protein
MRYVSLLMLLLVPFFAAFHPCSAFKVDPYESELLTPRMYQPASAPPMQAAHIPLSYLTPGPPGEGGSRRKDMRTGEGGHPIIFTLEMEVSHSEHTLKLIGSTFSGGRDVLHDCKIGLGAADFPTPVGVYYVTRIFDEEPWWIPPPSPWALGESPSRTVYGGAMAPLLMKRFVGPRRRQDASEDLLEGAVKLVDSGYRLHGTNAPGSIGGNQSHGCVRMLPTDAKQLVTLIKDHVGTTGNSASANGKFVTLQSPVRLNVGK